MSHVRWIICALLFFATTVNYLDRQVLSLTWKAFINDDWLLTTKAARELYHGFAEKMPIIDYHCHLSPREIAEDRRWADIAEVWLGGDHYKWRQMRSNGVDERFVTGDASGYEKFVKYAETMERLVGNPLFDRLERADALPRCILYSLNPRDTEMLASIMGCFQKGPDRGRIQLGSAWWFLDQKDGMRRQIEALSALPESGRSSSRCLTRRSTRTCTPRRCRSARASSSPRSALRSSGFTLLSFQNRTIEQSNNRRQS